MQLLLFVGELPTNRIDWRSAACGIPALEFAGIAYCVKRHVTYHPSVNDILSEFVDHCAKFLHVFVSMTYIYIYVCVYKYKYIYIYVCVCVCININIYIR